MIQSFTKFGFSVCAFKSSGGTSGSPTALTTSFQAFPVMMDATNSTNSANFPDDCNVQSIEFELTARDSATAVTMYLARDSAGDIAISPPATENVTNGVTTAAKGGAAFSSEIDYHFDRGTEAGTAITGTTSGKIYIIAKCTGGGGNTAGLIRVNWRA